MFIGGWVSLLLLLLVARVHIYNRGKRTSAVFVLSVLVCLAGAVGGFLAFGYLWQADAAKK